MQNVNSVGAERYTAKWPNVGNVTSIRATMYALFSHAFAYSAVAFLGSSSVLCCSLKAASTLAELLHPLVISIPMVRASSTERPNTASATSYLWDQFASTSMRRADGWPRSRETFLVRCDAAPLGGGDATAKVGFDGLGDRLPSACFSEQTVGANGIASKLRALILTARLLLWNSTSGYNLSLLRMVWLAREMVNVGTWAIQRSSFFGTWNLACVQTMMGTWNFFSDALRMQTMMTMMMRHACVRGLQFSKLGCALAGQMVIDVRADVVPNTGVIRGCDARLGKAQSWPTFVCSPSPSPTRRLGPWMPLTQMSSVDYNVVKTKPAMLSGLAFIILP